MSDLTLLNLATMFYADGFDAALLDLRADALKYDYTADEFFAAIDEMLNPED